MIVSQLQDDIIDIIAMNASGLWRGACAGRVGNFKFVFFLSLFVEDSQYVEIAVLDLMMTFVQICQRWNLASTGTTAEQKPKFETSQKKTEDYRRSHAGELDADDDNNDYGDDILELSWSTSSKLIYKVDELMKRW